MRTVRDRPTLLQRCPNGVTGQNVLPEADPRQRRPTGCRRRPSRPSNGTDVAGDRDGRPRPRAVGRQPGLPRLPPVAVPGRATRTTPTSCASTSTRRPASPSRWCARRRPRYVRSWPSTASRAYPKTTGNRGLHLYVRVEPGWDSYRHPPGGRRASPARWQRRRPDLITGAVVEGGARRRASSSTSTRTRRTRPCSGRGACGPASAPRCRRRSAGTSSPTIHPDELTMATVPARARRATATRGRRSTTRRSRSSRSSRATATTSPRGIPDAPWPPVYPKMPDEARRVHPSRARKPD